MTIEQRARARKVSAFVAALEQCTSDPAEAVRVLRAATPAWWAAFARAAGLRAPSACTVAMVLEVFASRTWQ